MVTVEEAAAAAALEAKSDPKIPFAPGEDVLAVLEVLDVPVARGALVSFLLVPNQEDSSALGFHHEEALGTFPWEAIRLI